ncbi:MAG: type II secretion system protein J [Sulfuricurvum sp.]
MMRRGFTLIETIVAAVLFALIAIMMFGTIDNLRKQHRFYDEKEKKLLEKNRIANLLRKDFDRADSFVVVHGSDRRYDTVTIKGEGRSLYGNEESYVVWLVLREDHRLIRLESAYPITLPIPYKSFYAVHADLIHTDCERFRIFESSRHRLVYIRFGERDFMLQQTSV